MKPIHPFCTLFLLVDLLSISQAIAEELGSNLLLAQNKNELTAIIPVLEVKFLYQGKYISPKEEIAKMIALDNEQDIFTAKQRIQKLPKPQHGNRKLAREANAKGLAYLKDKQITQAIRAFESAYQADRADVEIVTNLGYAYLLLDGHFLARDYLMQALYLSPDSVNAWLNLGHFYALNEEENNAIACLANAYRFSARQNTTLKFLKEMFIKEENENVKNAVKKTLRLPLLRKNQSDSPEEIQRKLSLLKRSNILVFIPSFVPPEFTLEKVNIINNIYDAKVMIDYEIVYTKSTSESSFTISSAWEELSRYASDCSEKVMAFNSKFFGEVIIELNCDGDYITERMSDKYMQQIPQQGMENFDDIWPDAGRAHQVVSKKMNKDDFIKIVKSLEPLPRENSENSQQPLVLQNLIGLWLPQSYLEDIRNNRAPQATMNRMWQKYELEEYLEEYTNEVSLLRNLRAYPILAILRKEDRYKMIFTNFHEAPDVELLRIEPTEKNTHYNMVYNDVTESQEINAISLYPQWDKTGRVEKINFSVQNETYIRIPLLSSDDINHSVQRYLNKWILAGTYKSDHGDIFSFSETQNAQWENKSFHYFIALDPTESDCEYFCEVEKGNVTSCYCYSWVNNQLKLSKMPTEDDSNVGKTPFAVLTPLLK